MPVILTLVVVMCSSEKCFINIPNIFFLFITYSMHKNTLQNAGSGERASGTPPSRRNIYFYLSGLLKDYGNIFFGLSIRTIEVTVISVFIFSETKACYQKFNNRYYNHLKAVVDKSKRKYSFPGILL